MKIWNRIPLPLLILVPGIAVVVLVAFSKPKPQPSDDQAPEAPVAKVQVVPATPVSTSLTVKAQGTVAPKTEIDLVAEVAGRVTYVADAFVNGGAFKASDVLLQIDSRDYEAAVLSAKARVAQARQNLAEERGRAKQAQREWRDLGNKESNDLFLRKPQIAFAEAEVQAAIAGLNKADLDLSRTRISVPFDGRVRDTKVNIGQYVSPGSSIATVFDSAVAEIRLPISDRKAALIDLPLGYVANDSESAPEVTISGMIGGEIKQWQGRIARTDASIDTRSRMHYAVAEIETPFAQAANAANATALPMGLFVDAEIQGKTIDNVLVLPKESVFKRNQIYVLDDQNHVALKTVDVLHQDAENIWIRADLATSTQILIEKQSYIAVGNRVEAMPFDGKKSIAAPLTPAKINSVARTGIER